MDVLLCRTVVAMNDKMNPECVRGLCCYLPPNIVSAKRPPQYAVLLGFGIYRALPKMEICRVWSSTAVMPFHWPQRDDDVS